jgi:hypothetical protein
VGGDCGTFNAHIKMYRPKADLRPSCIYANDFHTVLLVSPVRVVLINSFAFDPSPSAWEGRITFPS